MPFPNISFSDFAKRLFMIKLKFGIPLTSSKLVYVCRSPAHYACSMRCMNFHLFSSRDKFYGNMCWCFVCSLAAHRHHLLFIDLASANRESTRLPMFSFCSCSFRKYCTIIFFTSLPKLCALPITTVLYSYSAVRPPFTFCICHCLRADR